MPFPTWPAPAKVVEAVRASSSAEEACARIAEIRGLPSITKNALRKHWDEVVKPALATDAWYKELGGSLPKAERPQLPTGATRTPPPEAEGYWVSEEAPKSLVILPDIHFPYHDHSAISGVLEYINDIRPQRVVQIGDALDFYGVSSYAKTPSRQGPAHSLYEEVKSALPFWKELVRIVPEVDYLPGNHEERLQKNVVQSFSALDGHPALDLRSILQLPEKVRTYGYGVKVRIGNLTVTHGHKLRRGQFIPKYVAASVLAKYPNMNIAAGHTHKIDVARHTVYHADGPHHYAMRYIGWLGDASMIEYEDDPSYQQGLASVEFWKVGGKVRHTFNQIEIVNGQFKINGKVYGKRRRMR